MTQTILEMTKARRGVRPSVRASKNAVSPSKNPRKWLKSAICVLGIGFVVAGIALLALIFEEMAILRAVFDTVFGVVRN